MSVSSSDFMHLNCSMAFNETYKELSQSILSYTALFLWLQLSMALVGIFKSIFVLCVFYRIGWFHESQKLFFINVVITLLVMYISVIGVNSWILWIYNSNLSNIMQQNVCTNVWALLSITVAICDAFALFISLDRFLSVWIPFHWFKVDFKGRWVACGVAYCYGVITQIGFTITAPTDECVIGCHMYLKFPKNWWDKVNDCVIIIGFAIVIMTYIFTPFGILIRSKSCFILNRNCKLFNLEVTEGQQIRKLASTRKLCLLFGLSFITFRVLGKSFTFVGSKLYSYDVEKNVRYNSLENCWSLLEAIIPLSVCLLDREFRMEVLLVLQNVITCSVSAKKRMYSLN